MATGKMQDWRRKRGDRPSSSGADGGRAELRDGQAQLFGERGEQIALGDVAHVDEDLAELLAPAFALQFERAIEIFRGDQPAVDQKLSEWRCAARRAHGSAHRSCSSIMAASSGWPAWLPSRPAASAFPRS